MVDTEKVIGWAYRSLLVLALIVTLASLVPANEWADFERTRGVGPIDYTLEAQFSAGRFEYSITTRPSENSGGVIGGIGGGLGSNVTIGPVEKRYYEVRGEVLENLGIVYDSYKEKSYIYELVMLPPPDGSGVVWEGSGSPSVYLNVTLRTDLVPYWPESSERELSVDITLIGSDLHSKVGEQEKRMFKATIASVQISAKTGYDQASGSFKGEDVLVTRSEDTTVLRDIGDGASYLFKGRYPEGTDVAGLFAEIKANLTDYWGRPERSPLTGNANTINIRSVSNPGVLAIIGVPLAFPLGVIVMIAGLITLATGFRGKRPLLGTAIFGTLIAILCPLWFFLGMESIVGLLSERLSGAEQGLSWGIGIYMAWTAAVLNITALALMITGRVISIKAKRKLEAGRAEHPEKVIGPEGTSPAKFTIIKDGPK